MSSRRQFLKRSGLGLAGVGFLPFYSESANQTREEIRNWPEENEVFWKTIRNAYDLSDRWINLNNGGVSPAPRVVLEAFEHYNRQANELPAYYLFRDFKKKRKEVKEKLANLAGCEADELALCRNATEALETCIFGLDLKKGEEILTTDQDYPSMLSSLEQRTRRDGIKLTKLQLPVPAESEDKIVQLFENAISKKTRVILVCHMINITGQIMPIRKISKMAREHGVKVICDGAHSFAQLDFKIPDLECDYFGTSLHKWLGAPFGCGLLWVKKENIASTWPLFGGPEKQEDNISKFDHLGTRCFPAELAISEAIDFHISIGQPRKENRLRFLKNYWAEKVNQIEKLKLLTSLQSEFSCSIGTFQIEGHDMAEIAKTLNKEYGIYTTRIDHPNVNGIRISPNVFTQIADLDKLVAAIQKICG